MKPKITLPSERKKNPADTYYRAKELRAAGQSLDELMDCENGFSLERMRQMFRLSVKLPKRVKMKVGGIKSEKYCFTYDGKEVCREFDVAKFEYPCRRKKPYFMFYIQTKATFEIRDSEYGSLELGDTITSEARISWAEYRDKQKLRAFLEDWLQYEDLA